MLLFQSVQAVGNKDFGGFFLVIVVTHTEATERVFFNQIFETCLSLTGITVEYR